MESDDGHFTPEAVEQSLKSLGDIRTARQELHQALGPRRFSRHIESVELPNPRRGEKVCIAYPHLDTMGANFVDSVLRNIAYDRTRGNYLMHNSGLINQGALCSVWGRSMELAYARNTATAAFLSSDSDWLLWWDTDIGCEQDAVQRLMEVADPDERPIVGGLCFVEGDYAHDMHGGLRSSLAPTMYDWTWVEPKSGMPGAYKLINRQEWPANEVVRVGATGCGFLLVHRSVYNKISDWLIANEAPGNIWHERIPGPDGELSGEDISFCMRANQVGVPIHVHTGITTTHQKSVWYGLPEYKTKPFTPPPMRQVPLPPDQWPKLTVNPNAARDAAQNSPTRERQVPEAAEEVAIIVPVAKRPGSAVPFLSSLESSLTPAQRRRVNVYVMADAEDPHTISAWLRAAPDLYGGVDVIAWRYKGEMGTFAEKVNYGYEVTAEPWLFLVGDDVKFHPGWLDQAMHTARTTNAPVVGTNDLGNPAVLAGEHATHMFVEREYVRLLGASWDGPGVLAHEGYRHWYVDNEIVAVAKERGSWEPCLMSRVEHLHPYFRKGEMDDVYRAGESAAGMDAEIFKARAALYGARSVPSKSGPEA